jgi:hypothetical protein
MGKPTKAGEQVKWLQFKQMMVVRGFPDQHRNDLVPMVDCHWVTDDGIYQQATLEVAEVELATKPATPNIR